MQIAVELPDTALFLQFDREYLRKALIAMLYNLGKISEKEACLILKTNRRAFEELLPEFGFSILSDNKENIQIELNA